MSDTLTPAAIEENLLELDKLLESLPKSLPLLDADQSCSRKLLSFHPLPVNWLTDIGEVGTVNRQLEVIFGTRASGLKLKERGSALETVTVILRHYLKLYPDDLILQKWLIDLKSAALEAHSSAHNFPQAKVSSILFTSRVVTIYTNLL